MSINSLLPADFITLTDQITAMYLAGVGTSGTGYGLGDASLSDGSAFGMNKKARNILATVVAKQDYDFIHALLEPAKRLKDACSYQAQMAALLNLIMPSLSSFCSASGYTGVTGIATFAAYFNTGSGGPLNALLSPDFATVLSLTGTALTGDVLANVYAPAVANVAQKGVGGSQTITVGVDPAKYGGWARSQVTTTGFTGASDVVTVTGVNQLGQSGRTWTATVAANGIVALVPMVASDMLQTVTAISIGALITAGSVLVAGLIPGGRVNPPT